MNTYDVLEERLDGFRPKVLLTLGSGLGGLADAITDPQTVQYAHLWLPETNVPGHSGQFVFGELAGVPVLAQQGRVHLYEGFPAEHVVAFVRAAAQVGVENFVVTNAAGGLNPEMEPGDVMMISDHMNLTGTTPLSGAAFLDMADAYDPDLRAAAQEVASTQDVTLREGVYAGLHGPAFETPAEAQYLRTIGADAVGMSTVLEVLAAREAQMRVAGFSLITNVHRHGAHTNHDEVLAAGEKAGPALANVLSAFLPRL